MENLGPDRMDSEEGGQAENTCSDRGMDREEGGELRNPCSPEDLLSQLFLSEPVTTEETDRPEHDNHSDIDDLLDSGSEKEDERGEKIEG